MVIQFKPLTIEEFNEFIHRPENIDREFEYIGGGIFEVVSHPRSSKLGARISGFFFVYLSHNDIGHLTGADGGYMVSGERYIPDVGFIRYDKQAELLYIEGYNPYPPDLAVEVLSSTNDDEKMRIKITNYLAAGTFVWVVNPEQKLVEVYEPGKPVKIFGMSATLTGGDILPGFTLAVKDIFAEKKTN
jgi:Uma2 family endonuclease